MCEGCRIRCIGLAGLRVSPAGSVMSSIADGVVVEFVIAVPRGGVFRRVRRGHEQEPGPADISEFGPRSYAGRAVFAFVAWHERI